MVKFMYSEFQVACIFRLCHIEIENKKIRWSVLCIFDTVCLIIIIIIIIPPLIS